MIFISSRWKWQQTFSSGVIEAKRIVCRVE